MNRRRYCIEGEEGEGEYEFEEVMIFVFGFLYDADRVPICTDRLSQVENQMSVVRSFFEWIGTERKLVISPFI